MLGFLAQLYIVPFIASLQLNVFERIGKDSIVLVFMIYFDQTGILSCNTLICNHLP
jgi:hypothetical protein